MLLFVVSMITFAIFFLVPRLAGATPETLAARYVGKTADADAVHAAAERLGFNDPIYVQYWHWLKGIFAGRTTTTAPASSTARRPASATPSSPASRSCPRSSTGSRSPSRWPSARPSSG